MNDGFRVALAVVAGVVLWGLAWNLGNVALAAAFPDELAGVARIEAPGLLLVLVAYSVLLSGAAGWLAASLAGAGAATAVLVLGVVDLALAIVVQTVYWEMMPLWYHLLFLAGILPATIAGGRVHGLAPPRER